MGRLVEGLWNCKYCGTKKIKGRFRSCPNCGKARDNTTKFYMDTSNVAYVPEDEDKEINRNPDWICTHCQQLNSDSASSCRFCGSPRTLENIDYFKNQEKEPQNEEVEEDSAATDDMQCEIFSPYYPNQSISSPRHFLFDFWRSIRFEKFLKYAIVFLVLLGVIGGILYAALPKVYSVTITEKSWEREISIYQYCTLDESDWSLPPGARLSYTRSEFSHYDQVLDHYELKTRQVQKQRIVGHEDYVTGYRDLGNGYFEEQKSSRPVYETYYENETYNNPVYRDDPVYRTKYYYEIDRWVYCRAVITSGLSNLPYWGDVTLLSDERVESKNEKYSVSAIRQNGKSLNTLMSFEDWTSVSVGSIVKLKISLGHGSLVN